MQLSLLFYPIHEVYYNNNPHGLGKKEVNINYYVLDCVYFYELLVKRKTYVNEAFIPQASSQANNQKQKM